MRKESIKKHFIKVSLLVSVIGQLISPLNCTAVETDAEKEKNEKINEKSIEATQMLEELLQLSYDEKKKELEEMVIEGDYSMSLTMQSLEEKGNPFDDADYLDILASYCMTVGKDPKSTILDFDFLTIDAKEATMPENVATKTYEYVATGEDGLYERGHVKYITEACDLDEYEEVEDGLYKKIGTIHVEPEIKEVKYLDVRFVPLSPESILDFYGLSLNNEETLSEYETRVRKLQQAGLSSQGLRENIFIQFAEISLSEDAASQLNEALATSDTNGRILIETAASLIGNVTYQWGGKPRMKGFDSSWGTFTEYEGKTVVSGLDCSGFVTWAYDTAGFPIAVTSKLYSTANMLSSLPTISYEELQIGDLGLLNHGEKTNHVGIYIGNGYFIHCSSGANGVTIQKGEQIGFTNYKSMGNIEEYSIVPTEVSIELDNVNYDDAYLMAQTISHEAKGEGLNGWVAVGEVIMNRINSDNFPNTVEEVVYAKGQFEGSENIKAEVPSPQMIQTAQRVLAGQISILNDPTIVYFNNPEKVSEDKLKGLEAKVTINHHTFYSKA